MPTPAEQPPASPPTPSRPIAPVLITWARHCLRIGATFDLDEIRRISGLPAAQVESLARDLPPDYGDPKLQEILDRLKPTEEVGLAFGEHQEWIKEMDDWWRAYDFDKSYRELRNLPDEELSDLVCREVVHWLERHALDREIAAEKAAKHAAPPPERPAHVTRMSQLTPAKVSWVWPGRIPRGKVTILMGPPGIGKSLVALDLAARVSRGMAMPRTSKVQGPKSKVEEALDQVSPVDRAPLAGHSALRVADQCAGAERADRGPQEPNRAPLLTSRDCEGAVDRPGVMAPSDLRPGHPRAGPVEPRLGAASADRGPSESGGLPLLHSRGSSEMASGGGGVVLVCNDGHADTVQPRLLAAGADLDRIACIEEVYESDTPGAGALETPFNLARDFKALERTIAQTPDCQLVVIDPITTYLSGKGTAAAITALGAVAAKYNVAIVAVVQTRATGGMPNAVVRALMAEAPVAWSLSHDPDDPLAQKRLMQAVKHNLTAQPLGMSYQIAGPEWEEDREEGADEEIRAGADGVPRTPGRVPLGPDRVSLLTSRGCEGAVDPPGVMAPPDLRPGYPRAGLADPCAGVGGANRTPLDTGGLPLLHSRGSSAKTAGGGTGGTFGPVIVWDSDPVYLGFADLRNPEEGRLGRKPIERDAAIQWLREEMRARPQPLSMNTIMELGVRCGHSVRTLYRAAQSLGIRLSRPGAQCEWQCRLPGGPERSKVQGPKSQVEEALDPASPAPMGSDRAPLATRVPLAGQIARGLTDQCPATNGATDTGRSASEPAARPVAPELADPCAGAEGTDRVPSVSDGLPLPSTGGGRGSSEVCPDARGETQAPIDDRFLTDAMKGIGVRDADGEIDPCPYLPPPTEAQMKKWRAFQELVAREGEERAAREGSK